jgi:hypothetical protein
MTLKFAHQPVAAEESVRAALTKELRLEEPFFREQKRKCRAADPPVSCSARQDRVTQPHWKLSRMTVPSANSETEPVDQKKGLAKRLVYNSDPMVVQLVSAMTVEVAEAKEPLITTRTAIRILKEHLVKEPIFEAVSSRTEESPASAMGAPRG